jgi:two-component system, chemotaxis family, CheB/CheR fusion protein
MSLRGVSVLVVEDDRDHRELAREMLTALGARVTVAVNGEEGVKRLIKEGCPDLVLCDLRMPVMDGYEFAREVRTHSPCRHVRLVALTALRDPIAYTRTWSAGYDAHLEKPLTVEKLEDLAGRLLSGGATSGR